MNKKKLKKLALKGVCGGLLISAPGLIASQGSEAMANFIANSSGQIHGNYLAGGCGGGSCGGGNKTAARQSQPQHSCGGGSNNLTAYENQSHGGCSGVNAQRWNQYADQYQQPQGGCRSHGGCSGGSQSQPQGGYGSQSGYNSNNGQQWNQQQQGSYSNNQLNTQNNNAFAHSNDEVEVEYDGQSIPSNRSQSQKSPASASKLGQTYKNDARTQGQIAIGGGAAGGGAGAGAAGGSMSNLPNNSNLNNPNANAAQQWQTQKPQNPQTWQGQQNSYSNPSSTSRMQGQLATGMVSEGQKLTESEFKAMLNSHSKKEFEELSPSGKALALKMANQICAHQNDCKGQNSCKSKINSCAGLTGCKGTAETNFKDKNMAVKVAKMAEKRNKSVNPNIPSR